MKQFVIVITAPSGRTLAGVYMKSLDQDQASGFNESRLLKGSLREEVGEHDQIPILLAPVNCS